ncbi:MAG TPA: lipocalin-like domain-containing protein [Burkholderiales bacterium]|nr:lipocalin-like domain-containing protein [Burkholderiales bacterium]
MAFMRCLAQAIALVVLPAVVAPAIAGEDIVGTWTLVSMTSENTETGEVSHPYGQHPQGQLICTQGGHMQAIIVAEGRKRFGANRFTASVEDQAEAFKTMNAIAGTYTLTDTGVTFHVGVASIESWAGSDHVRSTERNGDRLTIKTGPLPSPPDGKPRIVALVWQRIE